MKQDLYVAEEQTEVRIIILHAVGVLEETRMILMNLPVIQIRIQIQQLLDKYLDLLLILYAYHERTSIA